MQHCVVPPFRLIVARMSHAVGVGRGAAPAIRNAPLWLEQHLRAPWSSPALVPHLRGEQGAPLVGEIIAAFETGKLGAPVKIRTLLALLGLSKAERAAAGVDRQLLRLLDLADEDHDEWVCVVASMVRRGVFGAPSGQAQPGVATRRSGRWRRGQGRRRRRGSQRYWRRSQR